MGTGIHTAIEVRHSDQWQWVPPESLPAFTPDKYMPHIVSSFWQWRNYALFAVLAGVRNGAGLNPLASRRGVPADCSDDVRFWSLHDDYHSHTHYLLVELLTTNWSAPCSYSRGGLVIHTTYADYVGQNALADLEILRKWAEEQGLDPEDVRILVAFDN